MGRGDPGPFRAPTMPITKSAKKALRQSKKKRIKNIQKKKELKDILKKIEVSLAEKKTKEARSLLPRAYKLLDKAAKSRLIKANTAARKKSRITKLINRTK